MARYVGRLTGDDVCVSVRILGRNDDVYLTRSDREALGERNIYEGPISQTTLAEVMQHTELQVEPTTVLPPQDDYSDRVRNIDRQVCIIQMGRQHRSKCSMGLDTTDGTYPMCPCMRTTTLISSPHCTEYEERLTR